MNFQVVVRDITIAAIGWRRNGTEQVKRKPRHIGQSAGSVVKPKMQLPEVLVYSLSVTSMIASFFDTFPFSAAPPFDERLNRLKKLTTSLISMFEIIVERDSICVAVDTIVRPLDYHIRILGRDIRAMYDRTAYVTVTSVLLHHFLGYTTTFALFLRPKSPCDHESNIVHIGSFLPSGSTMWTANGLWT